MIWGYFTRGCLVDQTQSRRPQAQGPHVPMCSTWSACWQSQLCCVVLSAEVCFLLEQAVQAAYSRVGNSLLPHLLLSYSQIIATELLLSVWWMWHSFFHHVDLVSAPTSYLSSCQGKYTSVSKVAMATPVTDTAIWMEIVQWSWVTRHKHRTA